MHAFLSHSYSYPSLTLCSARVFYPHTLCTYFNYIYNLTKCLLPALLLQRYSYNWFLYLKLLNNHFCTDYYCTALHCTVLYLFIVRAAGHIGHIENVYGEGKRARSLLDDHTATTNQNVNHYEKLVRTHVRQKQRHRQRHRLPTSL